MKKLPALLNTPTRAVMAVGLIVLLSEYLIMALFDVIHGALPTRDDYQLVMIFNYLDPILLIAIVSPVLYILIFQPMRNQQAELARQVDELHRFQKMAVGRELRMKELVDKIDTLRIPLSAETQLTASSPEKPRDEAAQPASTSEMEAEQRSALLFMLEDLENSRRKVEQAHQEWMAALDVVNDPIFLHDREFRILRCNKAYQQCAGIPFHEIIGKPYYEVFPKNHAPLPCCLRAMEKAEEEEEEEVAVGEAIYRSRAFSIRDEQGAYLYSVHTVYLPICSLSVSPHIQTTPAFLLPQIDRSEAPRKNTKSCASMTASSQSLALNQKPWGQFGQLARDDNAYLQVRYEF